MTAQLQHYRASLDYSYSFGYFATLELLRYRPQQVRMVVMHSKLDKGCKDQLAALTLKQGIVLETRDDLVEKLAAKGNVYVFAVFEKYAMQLSQGSHVLLVNPSYAGNLGTIMRTMLAFGLADLALLSPALDVFNPHVIRASIGASFRVNAVYFDALETYQAAFPQALYPFMLAGQKSLDEVRFETPCTLVFGPEWPALPEHYHSFGTSIRIPQSDAVESLSLPVAVGIALYAWQRQGS